MTLNPRDDFDEPVRMNFDEPSPREPFARNSDAPWDDDPPPKKTVIPRLPDPKAPEKGDKRVRGISNRNRSAANMRIAGASYLDIADLLEFPSAAMAKKAVESVLAVTHNLDELDSLRRQAVARAEQLFARSSAMAGADYLVDDDGNRIANGEKLRWHQQAAADLMNWAAITGTKAATKVEFTPGEERMDQIVSQIMERMGHEEILDAEVLELEQIPDEPDEEDE